jgi:hypothetical protein
MNEEDKVCARLVIGIVIVVGANGAPGVKMSTSCGCGEMECSRGRRVFSFRQANESGAYFGFDIYFHN